MGGGVACIIFLATLFMIQFRIMIVLWTETELPTANIQDLNIPALNTKLPNFNSTTTTATFFFFDLELKNSMEGVGVRSETFDLAFYYVIPKSSFSIANYTIPDFYQGHKKTAHRRDVVKTRGMPWSEAFVAVSNGSTVVFKVEFSSTVKLKRIFGIYSRKKELLLGTNVEVNGYGEKVQKKGTKMKRRVHKRMKDTAATPELNLPVVDSNPSVYSA